MTAQRLLQGRYQAEGLLGSGGMATVWRGRDLRLDRPIAIKELTAEKPDQRAALERFEREARAVARLSHSNVVSVHDYGVHEGKPFLIMELVDGPTVAMLLDAGPLPLADALALASQICDGLTVAHSAGIIHRDIKPANLILTATGVLKICDFGVVQLLDLAGQARLTATAEAMGSPMYMAPEQISGGRVDPRTDLYALGCTMYAMLTGGPPFSSGGPLSIVHQHVHETPQPLRQRRADVPPEVDTLVSELLAKAPDQRPPDAAAVRSRIASIMNSLTPEAALSTVAAAAAPPATSAAGATVRTPTARPWGRRRWRRPIGALALAAIPVAAMGLALLALRPSTGPTAGPPAASPRPTEASVMQSVKSSPSATTLQSATPSAAPATSAPAATRTPDATQTPTAPPPPPPDPIVALRLAIRQQVDAGHLNADAARDLNHAVDDLAKAIANDNPDDEAKKVKALRDKLTSLYKEGKLSADGYRTLNSKLDQVAVAPA